MREDRNQMIQRRAPALHTCRNFGRQRPIPVVVETFSCPRDRRRKIGTAARHAQEDVVGGGSCRRDHAARKMWPVLILCPARNSRGFIGRLPSGWISSTRSAPAPVAT